MKIIRWIILWAVVLALALIWTGSSYAEGGQVFYRIGSATLFNDRGGEVFTDTADVTGAGKNDDDSGFAIGAGLDLPLTEILGHTLLGEIYAEYAQFSSEEVLQTTSALETAVGLLGPSTSEVTVSSLIVVIAPKYRLKFGKFRPWIIPIGLAFIVNSPPSNDTNYLDYGGHFGAGAEYQLIDLISIGVDYRLTLGTGQSGTENDYGSLGAYLGINF